MKYGQYSIYCIILHIALWNMTRSKEVNLTLLGSIEISKTVCAEKSLNTFFKGSLRRRFLNTDRYP